MGFSGHITDNRIRINLSKTTMLVMEEDMFQFGVKDRSTFINRIFSNYYESSKASLSLYLMKKKKMYNQTLALSEDIKYTVVQQLLEQERAYQLEQIQNQSKYKYTSQIYRLNKKNMTYLQSEACLDADIYDNRVGLYLKCVIEDYAALPYIQREQVFYKEEYDQALLAIETHSLLKITTQNDMTFYLYPHSLEADQLSTRLYLTGYSKRANEADAEKYPASFRVPRLKSIKVLRQSGRLTTTEQTALKNAIATRTVQFLLSDEVEIRIKLTENGINMYNSVVYMRPAFDRSLSSESEYVFYCTQRQAEYYFFKFGADAEVVAPVELRERFAILYKNALEQYE